MHIYVSVCTYMSVCMYIYIYYITEKLSEKTPELYVECLKTSKC